MIKCNKNRGKKTCQNVSNGEYFLCTLKIRLSNENIWLKICPDYVAIYKEKQKIICSLV